VVVMAWGCLWWWWWGLQEWLFCTKLEIRLLKRLVAAEAVFVWRVTKKRKEHHIDVFVVVVVVLLSFAAVAVVENSREFRISESNPSPELLSSQAHVRLQSGLNNTQSQRAKHPSSLAESRILAVPTRASQSPHVHTDKQCKMESRHRRKCSRHSLSLPAVPQS